MSNEGANHTMSLGQVVLDADTLDLDFRISEGYQAYGSELLRLSLLAIAGLSTVWLKVYLPLTIPKQPHPAGMVASMIASFILLLLSSTTALAFKYSSADSLAYHLTALRRRKRDRPASDGHPSDIDLAKRQEARRGILFERCSKLLKSSMIFLLLGVVSFGVGLLFLMA